VCENVGMSENVGARAGVSALVQFGYAYGKAPVPASLVIMGSVRYSGRAGVRCTFKGQLGG
jgi:hypothetical protein